MANMPMTFLPIDGWRSNLLIMYQWLCFTYLFAPISSNKNEFRRETYNIKIIGHLHEVSSHRLWRHQIKNLMPDSSFLTLEDNKFNYLLKS